MGTSRSALRMTPAPCGRGKPPALNADPGNYDQGALASLRGDGPDRKPYGKGCMLDVSVPSVRAAALEEFDNEVMPRLPSAALREVPHAGYLGAVHQAAVTYTTLTPQH